MEGNEDLFQELDASDREEHLKDNCYKSELSIVSRPYSPEKLSEFKELLSEDSVQLAALTSEFKKIKQEFDAKMKPLKDSIKQTTTALRNKFEESEEVVYLLDDQVEGLMKIYDKEGKFLYARKLFPNERQATINSIRRLG